MSRSIYGAKRTVEGCDSIDVLDWNKRGYFDRLTTLSIEWSRRGNVHSSIKAICKEPWITLIYKYRPHPEANWVNVKQDVPMAWTPCRFGGQRPWFVCKGPSNRGRCEHNVTKLYRAGQFFACRDCHGLAYASQQEAPRYAPVLEAQKIKLRLGGSANMLEPFPDRPKGMHWRTYDRLEARYQSAVRRMVVTVGGYVAGLQRRIERRRARRAMASE
jgi:hypothetical protein